jgi:hypothetical protein
MVAARALLLLMLAAFSTLDSHLPRRSAYPGLNLVVGRNQWRGLKMLIDG